MPLFGHCQATIIKEAHSRNVIVSVVRQYFSRVLKKYSQCFLASARHQQLSLKITISTNHFLFKSKCEHAVGKVKCAPQTREPSARNGLLWSKSKGVTSAVIRCPPPPLQVWLVLRLSAALFRWRRRQPHRIRFSRLDRSLCTFAST